MGLGHKVAISTLSSATTATGDNALEVAAMILSGVDLDELRLRRAVDGSYIVEVMPTDGPRRLLPNPLPDLGALLLGIVNGDIAQDVRGQGLNIYAILEKEERE